MTSIHSKLGLTRAGTRSMRQLPKDRAAAAAITSATCPDCQRTGARLSKTQPGKWYCPHCNTIYELPKEADHG
jgi:ribosomal protein L37AE/L43A